MQTTLTHEEVDILNKILPFIEYNNSFKLDDLHAIHILKALYPKEGGGVDLSKYDPARNELRKKGVYVNIRNYLRENSFALDASTDLLSFSMRLTPLGEALVAYGNIYTFMVSCEAPTIDKIEKLIPDIIARAFPYGEFTIHPELPRKPVINLNIFGDDEHELSKVMKALDPKEKIRALHRQGVLDEAVLQFLVNNGYAINRHDIKEEGVIYRQLTDKGRDLKECGSIEKYLEKVAKKEKEIEEERTQRKEAEIAQHALNKAQEKLAENQITTNDNVIRTNKSMKLILVITAIATGLAALPAYITLYREERIKTLEQKMRQQDTLIQKIKEEKYQVENSLIRSNALLDSCIKKPSK